MLSPLGLCSIILDLALSWLSVLGSWHSVLGFFLSSSLHVMLWHLSCSIHWHVVIILHRHSMFDIWHHLVSSFFGSWTIYGLPMASSRHYSMDHSSLACPVVKLCHFFLVLIGIIFFFPTLLLFCSIDLASLLATRLCCIIVIVMASSTVYSLFQCVGLLVAIFCLILKILLMIDTWLSLSFVLSSLYCCDMIFFCRLYLVLISVFSSMLASRSQHYRFIILYYIFFVFPVDFVIH